MKRSKALLLLDELFEITGQCPEQGDGLIDPYLARRHNQLITEIYTKVRDLRIAIGEESATTIWEKKWALPFSGLLLKHLNKTE
jgi:hypothetical protein